MASFDISGMLSPASTQTTASFGVWSADASLNRIDEALADLTVTMIEGITISAIKLDAESFVVGD